MSSLAKRLEQSFLTFEEFLARTSEEDRAFLGGRDFLDERFFFDREARERFAAACCGMANGKGGWIVFGAERSEQGNETDKDVFAVEGVADAARLEQELRAILRETAWLSANPISSFHPMPSLSSSFFSSSDSLDSLSGSSSGAHSDEPKTLLAVKVETAEWFLRPVCVKADFSPAREKEKSDACGASSCAACAVYRRVEGNNVVSGLDIRFRMALDALECARDDRPVPGLSVRDLDIESVVSFRRALLARCPHWVNLCEVEFLKRALVLDDDEKVTRAGQLLLGASPELSGKGKDKKNRENAPLCLRSKASRSKDLRPEDFNSKDFNSKEEKRRFAPNLWSAYRDILPELLDSLTENCAAAVRECFMNALLHADYDAGRVEIDVDADKNGEEIIVLANPGLPRAHGSGSARNYRLLRAFGLAGAIRDAGGARERERRGKFIEKRKSGLEIVRAYDEDFRLQWDVLDLFTRAELRLERDFLSDPACSETSSYKISSYGWMPVVEAEEEEKEKEERGAPPEEIETPSEEVFFSDLDRLKSPATPFPDAPDAPDFSEPSELSEIPAPEATKPRAEEPGNEEEREGEEREDEEREGEENDEEYLDEEIDEDEDDETGLAPKFGSLEEMVRNTPRLQSSIVREAILKLCEEYRSLPELASSLARSEMSLRRHYLSTMVREGLLQLKFPDKVGHPAQRYRTAGRQEARQKTTD